MNLFILPISILLFMIPACNLGSESEQKVRKEKNETIITLTYVEKADTIYLPNAPSRITRKIRMDQDGNLLFAAYENIIRYDGESFYHIAKESELESFDAFDAIEDRNRNLWIASTHFGLFRMDSKYKKTTNFTDENVLTHNRTMSLLEDQSGGIWIGSEGGINYISVDNQNKKNIEFELFDESNGLSNTNINTITEDNKGRIWVGTRGNLQMYNPSNPLNNRTISFNEYEDLEGNTYPNIWSIVEDKNGNIWVGGQNGLWLIKNDVSKKIISIGVMGVLEDSNGNIWFTHSGTGPHQAGLSVVKKSTNDNSESEIIEIFGGNGMFFGLAEDKFGDIWVGHLQGVFKYNGKKIQYFVNKSI